MHRFRILLLLAALFAMLLPTAASAHPGAQVTRVDLDSLNDSGVEGRAVLIQRGDDLRVIVTARGLEADREHFQHIHGFEDAEATCPPASAAGDDGLLTIGDGFPFYGPVLQPLTPYPTANQGGVVTYTQTFEVSGDLADLSDEVIVLHGATAGGEYDPLLPVACGEIS